MSAPADDVPMPAWESGPLPCISALLGALYQHQGEWHLHEDGVAKALDQLAPYIDTETAGVAIDQFLSVVGWTRANLGRTDLAWKLMTLLNDRISDGQVEDLKQRVFEAMGEKQEAAQKRFEQMLGPQPKQVEVEPDEKIDFRLPKGPVKG